MLVSALLLVLLFPDLQPSELDFSPTWSFVVLVLLSPIFETLLILFFVANLKMLMNNHLVITLLSTSLTAGVFHFIEPGLGWVSFCRNCRLCLAYN